MFVPTCGTLLYPIELVQNIVLSFKCAIRSFEGRGGVQSMKRDTPKLLSKTDGLQMQLLRLTNTANTAGSLLILHTLKFNETHSHVYPRKENKIGIKGQSSHKIVCNMPSTSSRMPF